MPLCCFGEIASLAKSRSAMKDCNLQLEFYLPLSRRQKALGPVFVCFKKELACIFYLETLLALDGVRERSIRLSGRVSPDQAPNSLPKKLQVIQWVVALDPLVKVGVKSNLLHILGVAELNKGLSADTRVKFAKPPTSSA